METSLCSRCPWVHRDRRPGLVNPNSHSRRTTGVNAPVAGRSDHRTDDDLVPLLAGGDQPALGPLYARYAPLIFNVAVQSLEGPGAEEVVQDVFLSVWRKAALFDPQRGTFRAWILQMGHFAVINELRRRGRRPRLEWDADGITLGNVP